MLITNALVYGEDFRFHRGFIQIEDGRIRKIGDEQEESTLQCVPGEDVLDAGGCFAIPGLIDMHFHGCMGADFCDGTQEAIKTLAEYELQAGVTAICPATLTLPVRELKHILAAGAEYRRRQLAEKAAVKVPHEAELIGINMEGPFISPIKKGAQNGAYIIPADTEIMEEFLCAGEGLVKTIGLAPEENSGFEEYIAAVKKKVHVSLAHTNADYDTAIAAIRAGADHAVHLFNAMPPLGHREPGTVGAVFDSPNVTAELICDGNHVHPAVVRSVFRVLGPERVILVSDSLRAAGLGDGTIMLGGQEVIVTGTKAVLKDGGNLAGSVTDLGKCLRIAVKEMGIALEDAVRAATANPARVLGVSQEYGTLRSGKQGDVVLLDEDLRVKTVIKNGIIINEGNN
ncbi:MAG: N-acetylglucosamine-6-phosphate deacetylase [Blautia sp.]|nr:N-acetylglucosamine-6-phosphate deacetylase [Blautia sp.]